MEMTKNKTKLILGIVCAVIALVLLVGIIMPKSQLRVDDVEEALNGALGTLHMDADGNRVNRFTYEIQSYNISKTTSKSLALDAFMLYTTNNVGQLTGYQLHVLEEYAPILEILALFEDKNADVLDVISKCLDLVCSGTPVRYEKWVVTREINQSSGLITIFVEPK